MCLPFCVCPLAFLTVAAVFFSIGPSSEVVHGSEYSLGTHVGRILKGTLHDNHPAVQRFDLLYMYLHNPDLCWQLNDSEQSSLQCVSE